jgi:GntR family transcriptional regulator
VDASEGTARALQCEIGQRVQRAVRVRHLEGKPFSHLTTFVPEEIGRSYSREDLASKPLLTLLERCGVVVSGAEQTISATLADTNVAPILGVEVGSPLLKIDRIVCDQEDSPVEYITGLYRPDLYNYRMTLSRVQNDGAKAWSPTG